MFRLFEPYAHRSRLEEAARANQWRAAMTHQYAQFKAQKAIDDAPRIDMPTDIPSVTREATT